MITEKKTRRRWTPDQKRRIATEARRRLAAGEKFTSIIGRLGVLEGSLRLWMKQFPERSLQPVEIVEAVAERNGIVLLTPSGFRFEGFDVASVVRVLEHVR